MNIAMLTTWNSACGIAEYSKNLVKEYVKLGHRVFLFTNKDPYDLKFKEKAYYLNLFVTKVFGVSWWGEDPTFHYERIWSTLNDMERTYGPIDVFHVQYQSSLYEPEGFNMLMKGIKGKKVITLHDSSTNPKHDFSVFDATITHRPMMYSAGKYNQIPFPVIVKRPVVFSFGMGRNDYDFIGAVCKSLDVDFYSHDARKDGWLTEEALFMQMKLADVIVLWYNEVNINGQSAALRTAIASHRSVITNNVRWFEDAPGFVYKCSGKEGLYEALVDTLHLNYIWPNSFESCAKKQLGVYGEV